MWEKAKQNNKNKNENETLNFFVISLHLTFKWIHD